MSVSGIILTVPSQDLDFKHHMFVVFVCIWWFEVRVGCSFCWYWWNSRPSLFINNKHWV